MTFELVFLYGCKHDKKGMVERVLHLQRPEVLQKGLELACSHGNKAIVEYLIQHTTGYKSALVVAITKKRMELVKYFLRTLKVKVDDDTKRIVSSSIRRKLMSAGLLHYFE